MEKIKTIKENILYDLRLGLQAFARNPYRADIVFAEAYIDRLESGDDYNFMDELEAIKNLTIEQLYNHIVNGFAVQRIYEIIVYEGDIYVGERLYSVMRYLKGLGMHKKVEIFTKDKETIDNVRDNVRRLCGITQSLRKIRFFTLPCIVCSEQEFGKVTFYTSENLNEEWCAWRDGQYIWFTINGADKAMRTAKENEFNWSDIYQTLTGRMEMAPEYIYLLNR
jgi:hypothetical protein